MIYMYMYGTNELKTLVRQKVRRRSRIFKPLKPVLWNWGNNPLTMWALKGDCTTNPAIPDFNKTIWVIRKFLKPGLLARVPHYSRPRASAMLQFKRFRESWEITNLWSVVHYVCTDIFHKASYCKNKNKSVLRVHMYNGMKSFKVHCI